MNNKDRIEADVALFMLPVGAVLTFVSVIAFITISVFTFATIAQHVQARVILLTWCAAALIVAAINAKKSIEVMSAIDWHPVLPIAALSLAITLAYPGWWL